MKLAVFGGTRGTGLSLLQKAADKGYSVTALARNPDSIKEKLKGVNIIKGDVFDIDSVKAVLTGSNAVISTIGVVKRSSTTNIYSEGVLNIAKAMEESKLRRLVIVAPSPGIDPNPDLPFYMRIMIKLFIVPMFGFMYRDAAKMKEMLANVDLDWTIVAVPMLVNSSESRKVRSEIGKPLHNALKISRSDLSEYLLSIIDDRKTFKHWIEVAW